MNLRKHNTAILFARRNDSYSVEILRTLKLNFRHVHVVWSTRFNEKINLDNLKKCDYIFCFRSYIILKKKNLLKAKIASINFHPSPPEYRGVGGVNYAVFDESKFFGVTAHLMDELIDHGKIFDVVRFKIKKNYSIAKLLQKTHFEQFKQAKRVIESISSNKNYLDKKLETTKFVWPKKIHNLKKLNNFYQIKKNISKKMLEKKIASTVFRNHLPYVLIKGKKFVLEVKKLNKVIDLVSENQYPIIKNSMANKSPINELKPYTEKIKIKLLTKNYINQVIELLEKNISSFKPDLSHNTLWEKFKKNRNTTAIVALFEDTVVGYGSITFENKIRGGVAGHIEEIVTLKKFRNLGVGKKIMNKLFSLAIKGECYKVVLQSNKKSEFFYTKLGFIKVNISMSKKLIN